jgi:predicted PurR-regulated permease PerM
MADDRAIKVLAPAGANAAASSSADRSRAVLLPVVTAMERRLGWRRSVCSIVLVLGIVVVIGAVVLVLAQAASGAVRGFSHDVPHILDKVRHHGPGNFLNGGNNSLDTLKAQAGAILAQRSRIHA